jgi:hypothetical membrane protein
MKTAMINAESTQSLSAAEARGARISVTCAALAIVLLFLLHFLSPEFDPSWRMVSEYALGSYGWMLSAFFSLWGISSWALYFAIRSHIHTRAGKAGLIILLIAGIGIMMAAIFDVRHPLHGVAAMLSVPGLPVAALLISYSLKKNERWQNLKGGVLLSAHFTWITLVLMVVSMMLLIGDLQKAGINNPEHVTALPEGVSAVNGWVNRLLVLSYCAWTIVCARASLRLREQ